MGGQAQLFNKMSKGIIFIPKNFLFSTELRMGGIVHACAIEVMSKLISLSHYSLHGSIKFLSRLIPFFRIICIHTQGCAKYLLFYTQKEPNGRKAIERRNNKIFNDSSNRKLCCVCSFNAKVPSLCVFFFIFFC